MLSLIYGNVLELFYNVRAVLSVILRWLDLELPVQSVPITTKVGSSNYVHVEVIRGTPLCNKVCQ